MQPRTSAGIIRILPADDCSLKRATRNRAKAAEGQESSAEKPAKGPEKAIKRWHSRHFFLARSSRVDDSLHKGKQIAESNHLQHQPYDKVEEAFHHCVADQVHSGEEGREEYQHKYARSFRWKTE